MWRLEKTFAFEASHQLPWHDGKCRRLHGHSWRCTIVLRGPISELCVEGPKTGMLVDYGDVSKAMKPLLEEYLDHWHLNDTTKLESPTSELLAQWIYKRLEGNLPYLWAVVVEETCTARCEYNPHG